MNGPRVRFAPAPTGLMHLGNVRTALMNYLFAQQKQGTFILRIEDTDAERNYDPTATHIINDLTWLGLSFQEGPNVGGPHAPYFQSQRTTIYQEKLDILAKKQDIYRCFCTTEELERKRKRQIAIKVAPRYDKICLSLSAQEIESRLNEKMPFIWRIKLDPAVSVEIKDLAHGTIKFDLKNLSDFALTRQDGTFTFMFANFVDDMTMDVTYVIRGEDHLTNTAGQAALYLAFGLALPIFWHLPIICNAEGKKLSKRDFGFSLNDLRIAGFLPEAIDNYLAIIGGGTFEQEIMPLEELAKHINFETMHSTGHIRYDVEKLKWINRKWIARYETSKLAELCMPYLQTAYPQAHNLNLETLAKLVHAIKTELTTLTDIVEILRFTFEAPTITRNDLTSHIPEAHVTTLVELIRASMHTIAQSTEFMQAMESGIAQHSIPKKELFSFLRLALIGKLHGPSIKDLIEILGAQEAQKRLGACL